MRRSLNYVILYIQYIFVQILFEKYPEDFLMDMDLVTPQIYSLLIYLCIVKGLKLFHHAVALLTSFFFFY